MSSSPIALIMPKRSDHSRIRFHRTCVVGFFRTRFLRALPYASFRNARPIGLSQACLTSKLFRVHSHSTSHKSLYDKPERANAAQAMSRFYKKWQKFAVVNGLSTPKRPQRYFVFAKPQVTIYRRQEECIPYRAQPQICAKKLTIRTKSQKRRIVREGTKGRFETSTEGKTERRKTREKEGARMNSNCERAKSARQTCTAAARNMRLQLLQIVARIHVEQLPFA